MSVNVNFSLMLNVKRFLNSMLLNYNVEKLHLLAIKNIYQLKKKQPK